MELNLSRDGNVFDGKIHTRQVHEMSDEEILLVLSQNLPTNQWRVFAGKEPALVPITFKRTQKL